MGRNRNLPACVHRSILPDRASLVWSPRVTVAREVANGQPSSNGKPAIGLNTPPPRNASDARDAFDRLFKK
jgi:hypothetical protein